MITEDYVSFETAKLLKEKGFDEPCWFWYNPSGEFRRHYSEPAKSSPCYEIACPTLQMAMKWLRDVHNICIVVSSSMFWGKYNVSIYKKGNDYPYGFDGDSLISSYEQACEAAIKYCLEHFI